MRNSHYAFKVDGAFFEIMKVESSCPCFFII